MKEHVEMDALFALQYSRFLFSVNVLFVRDLVPSDQVIKITCYSGSFFTKMSRRHGDKFLLSCKTVNSKGVFILY